MFVICNALRTCTANAAVDSAGVQAQSRNRRVSACERQDHQRTEDGGSVTNKSEFRSTLISFQIPDRMTS